MKSYSIMTWKIKSWMYSIRWSNSGQLTVKVTKTFEFNLRNFRLYTFYTQQWYFFWRHSQLFFSCTSVFKVYTSMSNHLDHQVWHFLLFLKFKGHILYKNCPAAALTVFPSCKWCECIWGVSKAQLRAVWAFKAAFTCGLLKTWG